MDKRFNLSVLLSLSALTSVFISSPSTCKLVFSNSIIRLLLIMSLSSVFIAKDHRLLHASVVTNIMASFVAILCKILTFVPQVVVPTLLSNFTFAAVVIAIIALIVNFIGLFIAGVIQGVTCISTGFIIGLYMLWKEKLRVKQGETELTEIELKDKMESRLDKLATQYKGLIKIYEEVSLVHIPLAVTQSSVRYVMFSFYSVMLPPLLNADESAKILPMDIVVYGFIVALGVHATTKVMWTVRAWKVESVVTLGTRACIIYVVRVLGEVYWCLVTTGLIAVPFAEKVLIGGSVNLFVAFIKLVLVDGVHGLCMSLSVKRDNDIPDWIKTGCAVGVGVMWMSYGMMLWEEIEGVNIKFAARYAMM